MICRDTPTHGWVGWLLGGSMGQWMGSGQMTPMIGCVGESVGQWVG